MEWAQPAQKMLFHSGKMITSLTWQIIIWVLINSYIHASISAAAIDYGCCVEG